MKIVSFIAICGLLSCLLPAAHAQFEKTDPQHEIEIGREAAREVESKIPLSKNTAMSERVKRIGQSLADAMENRAYPFEFKVIADPEFNAFCLPGGFMYVNEGLLTRITDDGALAYVMGHEMTHAAHRHYAKAMRKGSAEIAVAIIADIATRSNIGSQVAAMNQLSYSRSQEADADAGGLELAFNAGYDPDAALIAVQIMIDMEEKGRKIPDYLRDHPAGKDRYAALSAQGKALKAAGRKHSDIPIIDAGAQVAAIAGALPISHTAVSPFFPLAVGNEWTYRVQSKDGASSTYTIRVTDSMVLPDGSVTYRAQTQLVGADAVPFFLCTSATGVWRKNRPTDPKSVWKQEYAFSPESGGTTGSLTFETLPSETVSLPSGTFADTLKLRKKDAQYSRDCVFGRGIGLLQTVCAETGITETLISYKSSNTTSK